MVQTERWEVTVIGAGLTGMYALHKLRENGFGVHVYEAGAGVGGTWYWTATRRALSTQRADVHLLVRRGDPARVELDGAVLGSAGESQILQTSSPTSSTCGKTSASASARKRRTGTSVRTSGK